MERQWPTVTPAQPGPPPNSETTSIEVWHPDRNSPFLSLPALDCLNSVFGVHFGTAITACEILAYNQAGYLSSSHNRDDQARRLQSEDFDSIIHPGQYYYHLHSQNSAEPYPICFNFSSWEFPHHNFPQAWMVMPTVPPHVTGWPANPSIISERIKSRDTRCLVSQWRDSITTAHIVPHTEESWLLQNKMHPYLPGSKLRNLSPYNLLTLRYDLHQGQFDQGKFVFVPKFGNFLVHFLGDTFESSQLYHNVPFQHGNQLSCEALYARFAWALMKVSKPFSANFKEFQALGIGDRGDDSTRDEHEGGKNENDSRGGCGGTDGLPHHSGRTKYALKGTKHKHDDENEDVSGTGAMVCLSQDWEGQPLLEGEAEELEEDLETAAHTLSFFVDPDQVANPYHYENIQWYPGSTIVERRKQAYLESHPQIRAHSDQVLPDDYDTDENSM